MIHIPVSEFKNGIGDALNRVAYSDEQILLQRHGKNIAALISMKEFNILKEIDTMEEKEDIKESIKALKEINTKKDELISWNKVKKEFD
jgi:prevent-host-death family protein